MANLLTTLILASTLLTPSGAHSPSSSSPSTNLNRLSRRSLKCSRTTLTGHPHCPLAHEATEGPYYIPHPLLRSDITEDREGLPLTLHIHVVDVETCEPATGVLVDVWHADAWGTYSGWSDHADAGPSESGSLEESDPEDLNSYFSHGDEGDEEYEEDNGPPGPPKDGKRPPPGRGGPPGGHPKRPPPNTSRFLRGIQPTSSAGNATFQTHFPGWYAGRSTHIHIRIHTGNTSIASNGTLLDEGRTAHTGQLFFLDEVVRDVSQNAWPYVSRLVDANGTRLEGAKGPQWNGDDGIFENDGGKGQIVQAVGNSAERFEGYIVVGVDLGADHTGEDMGPPGRGGPPGEDEGDDEKDGHGPDGERGPPRMGFMGFALPFVGGVAVASAGFLGWRWWSARRAAQRPITLE